MVSFKIIKVSFNLNHIQVDVAPQIDRGLGSGINGFERLSGIRKKDQNAPYPPINLDINPLINIPIQFNFTDLPIL